MVDKRYKHKILMFKYMLNTERKGQLNRANMMNVNRRNSNGVRRAEKISIIKCNTESRRGELKWLMKPKIEVNTMYLVIYTRKSSIDMCRLRCNISNLNQNLYSILLSDHPSESLHR